MLLSGICKVEKPPRDGGWIFHACDDFLHLRLYICGGCLSNISVQRSLHELCYECDQHHTMHDLCDLSKESSAQFREINRAIKGFETSHATMFDALPASSDWECVHPGSLHPDLKHFRDKLGSY